MPNHYDIRKEEDRARLPVWARDQIASLIRDKAELEKTLAVGPENSDTFVIGWNTRPDRPLGRRPSIAFGGYTTDHGLEYVLDARWHADTLVISSVQGPVNIRPNATNTFEVSVTRR